MRYKTGSITRRCSGRERTAPLSLDVIAKGRNIVKENNEITISLAWASSAGKAVGTFSARVESIEAISIVVQILDCTAVVASNPKEDGQLTLKDVADDIAAFRKTPLTINRDAEDAVGNGIPIYVEVPIETGR